MADLVRLASDVTAAMRRRPRASRLRAQLGGQFDNAEVFRLDDSRLARRIAEEIDAHSAHFGRGLLPLVRERPPAWKRLNGRKRLAASLEGVYLFGPRNAPEEWLAVGRLARELALERNGGDELHYSALTGLLWDRDRHDPDVLMSSMLAEDLGSACAIEALDVAARAGEGFVGFLPRVGCGDSAAGWFNVRATKAFAKAFLRVLHEPGTPRRGASIFPSSISLPWGWS